ncbi:hypothetical protein ACFLY6_00470 [Candidatus Dependentiae bacterium]
MTLHRLLLHVDGAQQPERLKSLLSTMMGLPEATEIVEKMLEEKKEEEFMDVEEAEKIVQGLLQEK